MNRIFRTPTPGFSGYAALAVFLAAYLAAATLILAPGTLLPAAPDHHRTQP